MQLDYASENPSSRWKMPARWYAVELPEGKNPLVKIVFLDGNVFEGALTPQEKLDQKRFLEAELEKETRAPWRWLASHYPLFTDGVKRDNARLIREWGEQLKAHSIPAYLAGHDHNLQHLEVEGHPTSFIVSGAGGASLYDVKPSERGFAERVLGFAHIHVTASQMDVQFITIEGKRIHAFRRTQAGKVNVIS
jgi:hypothetical protein